MPHTKYFKGKILLSSDIYDILPSSFFNSTGSITIRDKYDGVSYIYHTKVFEDASKSYINILMLSDLVHNAWYEYGLIKDYLAAAKNDKLSSDDVKAGSEYFSSERLTVGEAKLLMQEKLEIIENSNMLEVLN